MKHKLKITILILAMFLMTQFIGLYVVNHYLPEKVVDGERVNINIAVEMIFDEYNFNAYEL